MWNGSMACSCLPCFREHVVSTCKIGSFLCSLDNFLQKKRNCFLFGNQISKWRSFEKKRGIFWPTFHIFLVTREKLQKSFSTFLTHIHTCIFAHPIDFFLPYQFWKQYEFIRYGFSLVWVPGVDFLFAPFLEQSINNKMVSKI